MKVRMRVKWPKDSIVPFLLHTAFFLILAAFCTLWTVGDGGQAGRWVQGVEIQQEGWGRVGGGDKEGE